MTSPEITDILSELATAQKELRNSSAAFHDVIVQLGTVITAMDAANSAQGAAMDAVIAATHRALLHVTGREQ